jgi:hypothetical protein
MRISLLLVVLAACSRAPSAEQAASARCVFEYQERIRKAAEAQDSAALNALQYKLRSGEIERECGLR